MTGTCDAVLFCWRKLLVSSKSHKKKKKKIFTHNCSPETVVGFFIFIIIQFKFVETGISGDFRISQSCLKK